MRQEVAGWLNAIPIYDPLERRQARLLLIMLLIILSGSVIGLPLGLLNASIPATLALSIISSAILIGFTFAGIVLLRRGRFRLATALAISGLTLAIGLALIAGGISSPAGTFMAFTIPVTMGGLLLGRRGLLIAGGAAVGIVLLTALLQAAVPSVIGFIPPQPVSAAYIVPTFILIVVVLCLFLDRFGTSLREALATTQARELELEQLRETLESTVVERTAALQRAMDAAEQRETHLARTLEDLSASQAAIRELSAPVIPVLPGVLVAPLIGVLDSARAADLTSNVLGMVEREQASQVIFDITGVPLVDTHVAQVLLETTTAVRLLGAEALLVGIRPEVAQTLVGLNIDLAAIRTFPNLRAAITALLRA
jgi:anti-anti-sigma regulatory factor